MPEYHCHSCEDTEKLAIQLAQKLKTGALLAFFGDLGTGKTTFIRYLAQNLAGIHPQQVTSPTFQYLHIYKGRVPVYHFDLYRLQNSSDFIHMGFDEMLQNDGICCIEWAERIDDILPLETIRITITHGKEGARIINFDTGQQDCYK